MEDLASTLAAAPPAGRSGASGDGDSIASSVSSLSRDSHTNTNSQPSQSKLPAHDPEPPTAAPPSTPVVVPSTMTRAVELRLQLLPRIVDAGENGWISGEEEMKFVEMLQASNADPVAAQETADLIARSLDTLQAFHEQDAGGGGYDDYDEEYDEDYEYGDESYAESYGPSYEMPIGDRQGIMRRGSATSLVSAVRSSFLGSIGAASSLRSFWSGSRGSSVALMDVDDEPEEMKVHQHDEDALMQHMGDFADSQRKLLENLAESKRQVAEQEQNATPQRTNSSSKRQFGGPTPRLVGAQGGAFDKGGHDEPLSDSSDDSFASLDSFTDVEDGNSLLDRVALFRPSALKTVEKVEEPHAVAARGAVGRDHAEELFLETVFFARHRFVQPPCCLRCALALSTGAEEITQCPRPVLWRKDATVPLGPLRGIGKPGRLNGNVVVATCEAAQRLLAGEKVVAGQRGCTSAWRWDSARKRLAKC